jgi:uncharacterized membrane protein YvbJ
MAFCHKCGAELQPGDRFCAACGTEVREPVVPTERPAPAPHGAVPKTAKTEPKPAAQPLPLWGLIVIVTLLVAVGYLLLTR